MLRPPLVMHCALLRLPNAKQCRLSASTRTAREYSGTLFTVAKVSFKLRWSTPRENTRIEGQPFEATAMLRRLYTCKISVRICVSLPSPLKPYSTFPRRRRRRNGPVSIYMRVYMLHIKTTSRSLLPLPPFDESPRPTRSPPRSPPSESSLHTPTRVQTTQPDRTKSTIPS